MPKPREIKVELPPDPEPQDLSVHPIVSELRERLARVEERTRDLPDRTATEAITLAQTAVERAEALAARMTALESASAAVPVRTPQPEPEPLPELLPEPPIPDLPTPEPLPHDPIVPERQKHWWSRWIST